MLHLGAHGRRPSEHTVPGSYSSLLAQSEPSDVMTSPKKAVPEGDRRAGGMQEVVRTPGSAGAGQALLQLNPSG